MKDKSFISPWETEVGMHPEGTRLIRYHTNKKEADMKLLAAQHDYNPSRSLLARLLMSERRQKVQNRERSMLNRAALEGELVHRSRR